MKEDLILLQHSSAYLLFPSVSKPFRKMNLPSFSLCLSFCHNDLPYHSGETEPLIHFPLLLLVCNVTMPDITGFLQFFVYSDLASV